MFQWHLKEQQCNPEKERWGSCLPTRCQQLTSAEFWLFQSLLVAQERRWAYLSPQLPASLPCLCTSICKFPPLHHSLFLWQCCADNLCWGLLWVDVCIEWRRGFHPCHKEKGRVNAVSFNDEVLWPFLQENRYVLLLFYFIVYIFYSLLAMQSQCLHTHGS